jgi:diacylglycerol kinase (ATP)
MIRYPALELRLQADDGPWRAQPATLVAVMNGRSFGGSFRIAPMAIPQDGLLDVVIAERVTRRRILQLVPRLMRGSHLAEPDIHSFQARRLVVEAARPVLFEMDGELPLPPALRLEIEILPRALRMLS